MSRSVLKKLLGLQWTVVEDIELTDSGAPVVSAEPRANSIVALTAGGAARAMTSATAVGAGRRPALDVGTTFGYLEGNAPRGRCTRHGMIAAVPWGPHDAAFTSRCDLKVAGVYP